MTRLALLGAILAFLVQPAMAQDDVMPEMSSRGSIGQGPNGLGNLVCDEAAAWELALVAVDNPDDFRLVVRDKVRAYKCLPFPYPLHYLRTLRTYHFKDRLVRIAEVMCPWVPETKFYMALPELPEGVYPI